MACKRCMISTDDEDEDEEFAPCYASVLYLSDTTPQTLQTRVQTMEENVWPSYTVWCSQCRKPCMLTQHLHLFPRVSAHHVHQLAELQRLHDFSLQ
jgi:hypothetical protein